MTDLLEQFRAVLSTAGIPYSSEIVPDGKLHRFDADGEKGSASWYILHVHDDRFAAGAYGCWRRGIKDKWHSTNGSTLSAEDRRALGDAIRAAQQAQRTEEEQRQSECKRFCQQELNVATPATEDHAYLTRKQVGVYGEIRLNAKGHLLLPMRDANGALQTMQFIAPDRCFGGGTRDKTFALGGKAEGAFYEIALKPDGPIVLCEGYATGATIHAATGWSVCCAMFASNLSAVARSLKKKHPDRTFVIAADNDRFTRKKDGSMWNTGVEEAQKAAVSIQAQIAVPEFSDEDRSGTDFNDMAFLSGRESVVALFKRVLSASNDWRMITEDGSDTITEEIPDPIEIIDGLITEQSKAVIGGGSKTFKTWLSLNLSLAVQSGTSFLGRTCLKQRVLYVNLELKRRTFKKRVQHIVKHLNLTVERGWFCELHLRGKLSGLKVKDIVNRILDVILEKRCSLVILDPIYKVNVEGDENSSLDQTRLFNELDRITTEGNATLVFNDHFSKGNQAEKDPLDAIRGSSAKGGDVDAAIVLRSLEEPLCYRVDVVHRELPPVEPFCISWQFPVMVPREDLDPDTLRRPKKAKGGPKPRDLSEILSPMLDHPQSNPCSFRQWADALKISHSTLQPYVSTLRSKGFIATSGEGNSARQFITDAGIQFLNQQPP